MSGRWSVLTSPGEGGRRATSAKVALVTAGGASASSVGIHGMVAASCSMTESQCNTREVSPSTGANVRYSTLASHGGDVVGTYLARGRGELGGESDGVAVRLLSYLRRLSQAPPDRQPAALPLATLSV